MSIDEPGFQPWAVLTHDLGRCARLWGGLASLALHPSVGIRDIRGNTSVG